MTKYEKSYRYSLLQVFFVPVRVSVLTAQVGCSLIVDHARRQCAVIRWRGAEQDVVGHGLIEHGAA